MDQQTRNQYMKAMGIPVWLPRMPDAEPSALPTSDTAPDIETRAELANKLSAHSDSPVKRTALSPQQQSDSRKTVAAAPPAQSVNRDNSANPISPPDCSTMDWPTLQNSVSNCQLCGLHKSRTQTVFGTGDTQADWMIVGEAPGANEDRQGEPFVGRAGQLLNNMLAAVGLPRNAVYISNVLKCRPPNNRDPKPEESALCRGYLERQIALVKPALIIVVGRIAAHNLLQVTTPLGRLRGKLHYMPGGNDIPVIVTYHPAYLLRQPAEKRKAWQDLQLARQVMRDR